MMCKQTNKIMEKVYTHEKQSKFFFLLGVYMLGGLAVYMGVFKLVVKVLSTRETKPIKNMRLWYII